MESIEEKVSKTTFNFRLFPFSYGDTLVSITPFYFHPIEVDIIMGNAKKTKEKLGWKAKTKLNELVNIMINSDLHRVIEKGY